jgi:predicted HAD superfamily Cof-like phosphohydrolase
MIDPNVIKLVYDFNEEVIGIPKDLGLDRLTDEQFEWTVKALIEEVEEFSAARREYSIVGMTDAMIDLMYFAAGTLKKMGVTHEAAVKCFNAVHSANMTKKRGGKASRGNFGEDAVKPAEFVSPEQAIYNILTAQHDPDRS